MLLHGVIPSMARYIHEEGHYAVPSLASAQSRASHHVNCYSRRSKNRDSIPIVRRATQMRALETFPELGETLSSGNCLDENGNMHYQALLTAVASIDRHGEWCTDIRLRLHSSDSSSKINANEHRALSRLGLASQGLR